MLLGARMRTSLCPRNMNVLSFVHGLLRSLLYCVCVHLLFDRRERKLKKTCICI